jgi:hypothetical protein
MTWVDIPKPAAAQFKALVARLQERLTNCKASRKLKAANPNEYQAAWTSGYDASLDDEIEFLSDLLAAIEKS